MHIFIIYYLNLMKNKLYVCIDLFIAKKGFFLRENSLNNFESFLIINNMI